MSGRSVSRVLSVFSGFLPRKEAAICLAPDESGTLSDLPEGEGGPPFRTGGAVAGSLLLGLAPDKVYMPFTVAGNAVGSYPTLSLLTPFPHVRDRAVSFLLHFCTLTGPW